MSMPFHLLRLSARPRWLLLLLALLLLAATTQPNALAHALLVRSQPAANAELTAAPPSVEMWFSEPLESRFSHARLIDSAGEDVQSAGPSVVDPPDPTHLSLPLAGLDPGIYTVIWTTLSTVDGHEWVGSFPLTLLNPDGSRPTGGTAAVATGETGEIPPPLKGMARWLSLLGTILLAGGMLFRKIVAGPVLARQPLPALAGHLTRAWRLLGVVGLIGVLVGGWLQIGVQVAALGAVERLFDLLVSTQPGRLVLVRQLLLLPVVALLVATERPAEMAPRRGVAGRVVTAQPPQPTPPHSRQGSGATPPPLWGRLGGGEQLRRLGVAGEYAIGLVMLLTFSLASHAAAVPGRGWAVLGDFIHLLAAAAWMGGLLLLGLLFWQTRTDADADEQRGLGQIVRRFSLLAAGAVFVLTVTGLFSSAVQLPSLASLWTTAYGLLLLGKLALVALALGLAFFNNRAAHRANESPSFWLPRRVGIEALVSVGLLLVVALLVQTPPPPRPQPAVAPALPFNDIQLAGDLLIHLQITPNQPGSNRFWTHLYHPDTSPIGEVQLVRLFFAPKRAELGQARTDLPPEGNDIYVDEGAWMGQSGEWDVTVYVRRRGMDDATAQFAVTLPPPRGVVALGMPWQNPAAALPLSVLGGGLLLALGTIPFLWWRPIRRRGRKMQPLFSGLGLACLFVGLLLTVRGAATSQADQAEGLTSAVPVDWAATPEVATISILPSPTVSLLPTPVSPLARPDHTLTPAPPTPTIAPTPTPTPDAIFLAGAEIFQTHCVQCHGPHGMGDGPSATALPVQPAILPFHVPLHRDEDVYVFISEGFPNLGMPPFKETLSQEEILQVLRYLRVRFGGVAP